MQAIIDRSFARPTGIRRYTDCRARSRVKVEARDDIRRNDNDGEESLLGRVSMACCVELRGFI